MSLLIPNERDHWDAHGDLDQDDIFFENRDSRNSKVSEYWEFEPVHGFFKQSDESTNDMEFNYGLDDFGIEPANWESLVDKLNQLNALASQDEQYKLLFLARHGQGWHNAAHAKYTAEEWHKKWRFLGTDGVIEWGPDANLTQLGIDQAKENNQLWKEQLQKGAPIPTKFYVSPLRRSSYTLKHTWEGIEIPRPHVAENVRETIGLHPCHQRSTKTVISQRFPEFQFSPEFSEHDHLWDQFTPGREKLHEQFLRVNLFLESVFENDRDHSIISITSHAGTIRAFISSIGHRKFTIPTGGMIPVVVKGRKIVK